MAAYTAEALDASPVFDLELLMTTSQETRLGGETMDQLSDAWDAWVPFAHARKITVGNDSYLLAWLGEEIEEAVDAKWEEAPSEAFLFNALAQVMCMGIVHNLVPQVEEVGCAAAPEATDELADALEQEGVAYIQPGAPGLARRYAVVTYYPFKGGCETCSLRKDCPKGGGAGGCASDGPMSVEIPGFERN